MAAALPIDFLSSAALTNKHFRNPTICPPSRAHCFSLLKSCSNIRDFLPIHGHLITTNLIQDAVVAVEVLRLFINISELDYARLVFSRSREPETVIWNTLLENQLHDDSPKDVLLIYCHMVTREVPLDVSTFHFLIHACSRISAIRQGSEVHGRILKSGLSNNKSLKNNLMGLYAKVGRIYEVHQLFKDFPNRNIVSWNTIISCSVRMGLMSKALELFREMQAEGITPDEVTMISLVSACSKMKDLGLGKRLHVCIEESGLEISGSLSNCLINMYVKCGSIEEAHKLLGTRTAESDVVTWTTQVSGYVKCGKIDVARLIFDQMAERNMISWTTMMAGYAQGRFYYECLELFRQMQMENVEADEVTLVTVLSACAHVRNQKLGGSIHSRILKNGMSLDGFLGNTLIDMYAKCQLLDRARIIFQALPCRSIVPWNSMLDGYCKCGGVGMARELFDKMPQKDVVSWNTMINGYARSHQFRDLFLLFKEMQVSNARPDKLTMVSLLSSCAKIGALSQGTWVHVYIKRNCIELDAMLGTALVDMYAKCGRIEKAIEVFSDIPQKNVFLLTAMIAAYAMEGRAQEAISLYLDMEEAGIQPDEITYIALLSACSHGGLVDDGFKYFKQMSTKYNLSPKIQHYGCMVDLLGRVGRLDEATNLIRNMPIEPDISIWSSLMRACRTYKNIELAEHASKHLLDLDPLNDAAYVLLSNIYAEADQWEDMAWVRTKLKERGVQKQLGCSLIEDKGVVHEFTAGDRTHPLSREIYSMLNKMEKRLSQPQVGMDENKPQEASSHHSEKLAVAFGLISNSRNTPIQVVNNLRMCGECHSAMKLISKAYEREIVIRDNYRFHRFQDGSCSCRDYW